MRFSIISAIVFLASVMVLAQPRDDGATSGLNALSVLEAAKFTFSISAFTAPSPLGSALGQATATEAPRFSNTSAIVSTTSTPSAVPAEETQATLVKKQDVSALVSAIIGTAGYLNHAMHMYACSEKDFTGKCHDINFNPNECIGTNFEYGSMVLDDGWCVSWTQSNCQRGANGVFVDRVTDVATQGSTDWRSFLCSHSAR